MSLVVDKTVLQFCVSGKHCNIHWARKGCIKIPFRDSWSTLRQLVDEQK